MRGKFINSAIVAAIFSLAFAACNKSSPTEGTTNPTVSYSPSTVVDTIGKSATHTASTTGTVSGCRISPAIPTGLSIDSTCKISGTPSVAFSAANYTITDSNSTGTGSTVLNLAVLIAKPTVSYSPSTVVDTIGTAAIHTATTTGTVLGCRISPALPAGLSLNITNCNITGTPTAASSAANYTITDSNSTGVGSTVLNLAVIAAPTWKTVFSDDFNRADGSLGANYSVYHILVTDACTLSISNHKALITGGGNWGVQYLAGVPGQTVRVSATIAMTSEPSGYYGVGVTAKDTVGFYGYIAAAVLLNDINPGVADYTADIAKHSGGRDVPGNALISQAYALKKGGRYLFVFTADGSHLTFVMTDLATNVSQTLSATDTGAALTSDMLGIQGLQYAGDTTFIENFKIEKYE